MAGLIAAACLLAAAPMVVAVVIEGVALNRLAQQTEAVVARSTALARLGTALQSELDGVERGARQFIALEDPKLLDVFIARVRALESTLQRIETEAHPGTAQPAVQMRRRLSAIMERWFRGLTYGESLVPVADEFSALAANVEAIGAAGRAAADSEIERLRRTNDRALRVLWGTVIALGPLTALLAFAFSRAVTRPLYKLSRGIAALGHTQYGKPIEIRYPREMQRLGEQLDWLRRRLSDLEEDKDRFLRLVSHELKTPLASLHEGSSLLSDGALGPLSTRQLEVARILTESAGELASQIDNLLAYAEWREGYRLAELAWFEVEPLLNEALAAQRLRMRSRGLSAELDVHGPRLFGQRPRLRVALDNLLANAVKHAPVGSTIEIHAGVHDRQCELWVRDSGRGVRAQERDRIFEPFVRGSETEESGVRGTGIGLSIVKETVLAHGGDVMVEDARPGARFKLMWPCPAMESA